LYHYKSFSQEEIIIVSKHYERQESEEQLHLEERDREAAETSLRSIILFRLTTKLHQNCFLQNLNDGLGFFQSAKITSLYQKILFKP
jgi:hypothetical protein